MTSFSESIWADALLDRLEAYLVAQSVYSADAVWTYLGDGTDLLETPPRESFCAISVASLAPNQGIIMGGGRGHTQIDGTLTIVQYQRLLQDKATVSKALMKDRSRGLLALVRKLVSVLQLWDAKNTANNSPLVEPGRLASAIRFNPRRAPFGWASVESQWELKFRADIS